MEKVKNKYRASMIFIYSWVRCLDEGRVSEGVIVLLYIAYRWVFTVVVGLGFIRRCRFLSWDSFFSGVAGFRV